MLSLLRRGLEGGILLLLFAALALNGGEKGEDENKNTACDITIFMTGDIVWDIDENTVSHLFPEAAAKIMVPTIIVSEGATINRPYRRISLPMKTWPTWSPPKTA